jgi:galactonate dehydratase
MALHDIVGKKLGVPVYELLGGAVRERIPGFKTVGTLSRPDCLERVGEAVEEGFGMVRFNPAVASPGYETVDNPFQQDPTNVYEAWRAVEKTVERLEEVWEGMERRVPLGIDFHHRLTVAEAATFCQRIPPGSLAFLEEPIRCQSPAAYEALRRMTPVPLALGEEISNKWDFAPYIERGLLDYCRVDVANVGGLTEAKKIAGWCEAHYIDLLPHNPLGPVNTAASVHLMASCSNARWMEMFPEISESADKAFPVRLEREGAYYPLPRRPGLGVEVDEEALEREYPFVQEEHVHLQRPDGSHTNR